MPEVLPAFNSHHSAGGRKGCGCWDLPAAPTSEGVTGPVISGRSKLPKASG